MPRNTYRNTRVVLALLFASLLVTSRDLLSPSILPQEALVWTAFAGLAYLALLPLSWRRLGWAFIAAGVMAALNVAITSFNPVDPYYLTHWDSPLESVLVVLEGYALPLPLMFFSYRAYGERRRVN